MGFLKKISEELQKGNLTEELAATLRDFYPSYIQAIQSNGHRSEEIEPILSQYLDLVVLQLSSPYQFEAAHRLINAPFDYHQFGLDFIGPLVNFNQSKIFGLENINTIKETLQKNENVILFSNHQVEPDPQAINLLLRKHHFALGEEIIFVAGHRVTTDPLAVPFSLGVNLICIYSKNYIENPPELKAEKLTHNRQSMQQMVRLLNEGGKCIYVAPSGGRDRPDAAGHLHVAPFNAESIEMFRLMAQKAEKPVHFHTLALSTYALQPPPNSIEAKLGERRRVNATPIFLAFGPEIDMENCVKADLDKVEKRTARAEHIWKKVEADYCNFPQAN